MKSALLPLSEVVCVIVSVIMRIALAVVAFAALCINVSGVSVSQTSMRLLEAKTAFKTQRIKQVKKILFLTGRRH